MAYRCPSKYGSSRKASSQYLGTRRQGMERAGHLPKSGNHIPYVKTLQRTEDTDSLGNKTAGNFIGQRVFVGDPSKED